MLLVAASLLVVRALGQAEAEVKRVVVVLVDPREAVVVNELWIAVLGEVARGILQRGRRRRQARRGVVGQSRVRGLGHSQTSSAGEGRAGEARFAAWGRAGFSAEVDGVDHAVLVRLGQSNLA